MVIEKINSLSEREQIKAVKKYPSLIQYVDNQTEQLQIEAIKKDPTSIRFINNLSIKAIKTLQEIKEKKKRDPKKIPHKEAIIKDYSYYNIFSPIHRLMRLKGKWKTQCLLATMNKK